MNLQPHRSRTETSLPPTTMLRSQRCPHRRRTRRNHAPRGFVATDRPRSMASQLPPRSMASLLLPRSRRSQRGLTQACPAADETRLDNAQHFAAHCRTLSYSLAALQNIVVSTHRHPTRHHQPSLQHHPHSTPLGPRPRGAAAGPRPAPQTRDGRRARARRARSPRPASVRRPFAPARRARRSARADARAAQGEPGRTSAGTVGSRTPSPPPLLPLT